MFCDIRSSNTSQATTFTLKFKTMPIFVWIAIAIAVLLVGTGTGAGVYVALGHFFTGPIGYIVTVVFIIGVVVVLTKRSSK